MQKIAWKRLNALEKNVKKSANKKITFSTKNDIVCRKYRKRENKFLYRK